jgi:Fe-Mn family superoxide dismutase
MAYLLPKLPYDYDSLEPYIDKETMLLHHTKHHQTYIDNLNKALEGNEKLSNLSVEELLENVNSVPSSIKQAVINHGGGHANHSFFWKILSSEKTKPGKVTLEHLNKEFKSLEKFKEDFTQKAMTVFGSGWAFLILTKEKKLLLKRHSFQNSPLMHGNIPILGIDVWEHAYYLKYQNRRAEYIDAFWNIVNWNQVEKKLVEGLKSL